MQFNSYSYLLALAFAVAIFWGLPVRFRRGYVLLVSVGFYATWSPALVLLPLALCGITHRCAQGMRANPGTPRAQWLLRMGIGTVILVLVIAKYRGFLLGNLQALVPTLRLPETALQIALPLGISFYSF